VLGSGIVLGGDTLLRLIDEEFFDGFDGTGELLLVGEISGLVFAHGRECGIRREGAQGAPSYRWRCT
jgi:hypothetical protein